MKIKKEEVLILHSFLLFAAAIVAFTSISIVLAGIFADLKNDIAYYFSYFIRAFGLFLSYFCISNGCRKLKESKEYRKTKL